MGQRAERACCTVYDRALRGILPHRRMGSGRDKKSKHYHLVRRRLIGPGSFPRLSGDVRRWRSRPPVYLNYSRDWAEIDSHVSRFLNAAPVIMTITASSWIMDPFSLLAQGSCFWHTKIFLYLKGQSIWKLAYFPKSPLCCWNYAVIGF